MKRTDRIVSGTVMRQWTMLQEGDRIIYKGHLLEFQRRSPNQEHSHFTLPNDNDRVATIRFPRQSKPEEIWIELVTDSTEPED